MLILFFRKCLESDAYPVAKLAELKKLRTCASDMQVLGSEVTMLGVSISFRLSLCSVSSHALSTVKIASAVVLQLTLSFIFTVHLTKLNPVTFSYVLHQSVSSSSSFSLTFLSSIFNIDIIIVLCPLI